MLALPPRNSNNLARFSWLLPISREKARHSRMPQCYAGGECASGGQKTHSGSSGRPCLPRDHNAVPQWKRIHPLLRAVSLRRTAAHCSVGSFSGNCRPRETSLKSTHESSSGSASKRPRRRVTEFSRSSPEFDRLLGQSA